MRMTRFAIAIIFIPCAIGSIVRGVMVTNRLRGEAEARRFQQETTFNADPLHAPIPDYTEEPNLYDGPWIPLEFLFLGAFLITMKSGKRDPKVSRPLPAPPDEKEK